MSARPRGQTDAARAAVEQGDIVDQAFVRSAPVVQALRTKLAQGTTKAN